MTRIVGDEAMIYRSRMVPVVIDGDRARGVAFARRLYSPTHVLLDDAFQNNSIAKDLDILLLDAEEPLGNGRLLPAGTLRENPGAIARADVVIFTRAASREIRGGVGKYIGNKPVFFSSHRPAALTGRDGMEVPFSIPGDRQVAIYSGIARPGSFEGTVISTGMQPAVSFRFGDHHWYRREDVDFMLANSPGGAAFATTEKDWNKSADLFPAGIDLFALRVEADIGDKEGLLPLVGFGK
jgi:tetraacyldisaccharide 4'-kinase